MLQRYVGALPEAEVGSVAVEYVRQFEAAPASRAPGAATLARRYYELVTQFYERGWGDSFHFAPRGAGESLPDALRRYERHLGERLRLAPGQRVLELGCGIGGPMRHLATDFEVHVTGVTIVPYQVERGRELSASAGLEHRTTFVVGDFNRVEFPSSSFDAAYTIEACCHAADRRGPFGEAFRVLRPGGRFAGYDWCLLDPFNPADPDHLRIQRGIEEGNGVAALRPTSDVLDSLREVGFEVEASADWAATGHPTVPWYGPLTAGFSLTGFRNSRMGAFLSRQLIRLLEAVRLAPPGTTTVHDVLRLAQWSLVDAGRRGIFTPSFFWVARKPER
ncbi:MAG TPA: methyltransferase domain-containing protein [Myxococcaceae bacterium]|nr:methyltransferase domain-containing protein [Myxococcaceae bacterium]